jgi:exosortase E/protease (VPEID-CTERM system)
MPVVDPEQAARQSPVHVYGPKFPDRILGRVYIFTAILLAEYLAIVSVPHPWCFLHRAVAGAIVFVAVFLVVARASLKNDRTAIPLKLRVLPVYIATLCVIAFTHAALLLTSWPRAPLEALWFTAIPLSALALLCTLVPVTRLPDLFHRTRTAWLYATISALLVVLLAPRVEAIWDTPNTWGSILIRQATFRMVARVLHVFYPQVMADPAAYIIRLPHFGVNIAASCSGIEGLSLTLLFSLGWLWYARRELRFPQAFLLVPCALALIWILNILRIAILLIIGNSGRPQVAMVGFHSEAGWIAFNAVALGFLLAAHRIPWLAQHHRTGPAPSTTRNVAAIYLLPFLAILAAASFAKAISSGFEWAYPLRFLAAAAVLWHYRAEYRRIDWAFTWRGPTIGVLVFAMWLGLSHWTGTVNSSLGASLAAMHPARRIVWLIIRIAAAVLTVPIAEELAFRGFLLRRLVSADVESVAYRAVTPIAILLSSAAFGVMHGRLWLAGIVAGAAYALAVKRTNRLAEAVAAHATTNLLLAIWVLTQGDWGLW